MAGGASGTATGGPLGGVAGGGGRKARWSGVRVTHVRVRDILMWFVVAGLVLLAQRIISSSSWGGDLWLAVIVASFSVGLGALARNRRAGR